MDTKFFKATNDKVFKSIFLPNKNWNLDKRLIEEATNLKNIDILSVVSPELPKENVTNKGKTLDVLVKTNDSIYNIELNVYNNKVFHRRNFAYLATEYSNDLKVGEDYYHMNNHIQINITVSPYSDIPPLEVYKLRGENTDALFVDNLIIYEFNLSKMTDSCYNNYKFLQMLNYDYEEILEKCVGDKDMEQFKEEIERVNSDSEFIRLMTAEEEEEKYLNTVKKIEYNEGFEDGTEKGIEQGCYDKSKEIALNLLKMKMSINDIVKVTGLTEEQIKQLKKE